MRQHEKGAFCITSVCREDLKAWYTDEVIALLDDSDMEEIADKMADAYTEMIFWQDLHDIAETILEEKRS